MRRDKLLKEFADRLNLVLDELGAKPKGEGRQLWLADKLGVTQNSARGWLEGVSFPKQEHLAHMCEIFNISSEWLLTGKGDRFATPSQEELKKYQKAVNEKIKLKLQMEEIEQKFDELAKLIKKKIIEV